MVGLVAKKCFHCRDREKERRSLTSPAWLNLGVGQKVRPLERTDTSVGLRVLEERFMTVFLVCLGCGLCVVVWGSFGGCGKCKRSARQGLSAMRGCGGGLEALMEGVGNGNPRRE